MESTSDEFYPGPDVEEITDCDFRAQRWDEHDVYWHVNLYLDEVNWQIGEVIYLTRLRRYAWIRNVVGLKDVNGHHRQRTRIVAEVFGGTDGWTRM